MMSNEGAPKDGIKMQARDKEDPPANDAMLSPAGDSSGSDRLSEPSTVEINQQTLESAVKKNSDEEESSEPNGAITFDASATEGEAVVSAPPSKPSGAAASVEKKVKDTPSVKASVEAPKETEKNNKVAESSTKIVPDPKLDEASADNTTDVSPQEAASVEVPKEVASVQKGGFASDTFKGGDTAAVLSTEKKTIGDERNKGDPSPEKVTKPETKPPAMGVSYNVVRVDTSSEDAKMKEARDSDQDHDSTSRKKRSAAKSVESDGTAVSKRKKSKSSVFG